MEYGNDRGGFDRRPRFVPVKVGEEYDVNIEAVGEKGDGIAKVKGFVVFVPNVNEGDNVKIKISRVLRKVGFGEVVGAADAPAAEEAPQEEAPSDDFGEEPAAEEEPVAEEPAEPEPASDDFGEEPAEEETKEEAPVEEEPETPDDLPEPAEEEKKEE